MPRILVIGDSSFQRRIIRGMLADTGHEVLEAGHGAEGLEIVKQQGGIDGILLDLLMPEMDGFELLNQLRDLGCAVPRIVLTADVQEKSKACCLELGAAAVLCNPPTRQNLLSVLEDHFSRAEIA